MNKIIKILLILSIGVLIGLIIGKILFTKTIIEREGITELKFNFNEQASRNFYNLEIMGMMHYSRMFNEDWREDGSISISTKLIGEKLIVDIICETNKMNLNADYSEILK